MVAITLYSVATLRGAHSFTVELLLHTPGIISHTLGGHTTPAGLPALSHLASCARGVPLKACLVLRPSPERFYDTPALPDTQNQ